MKTEGPTFDRLAITDSDRRIGQRPLSWPRILSVSLVRVDWWGHRELLGTFVSREFNVDRLARHWETQLAANWRVPATTSPILFAGDPNWRAVVVQSTAGESVHLAVIHPRRRVHEVVTRVAEQLEDFFGWMP